MILTSSKEKGQVASILMTKICESKWKIKIFLGVFLTHLEFHFLSDVAFRSLHSVYVYTDSHNFYALFP